MIERPHMEARVEKRAGGGLSPDEKRPSDWDTKVGPRKVSRPATCHHDGH